MFKNKIIIFILVAFTASLAYCQEKTETHRTITAAGIVANVDAVGNVIEIKANEGQMAFSVTDDTSITEGTEKIGLMDIEVNNPVTIQYYIPSPGKFVAVSITSNRIPK